VENVQKVVDEMVKKLSTAAEKSDYEGVRELSFAIERLTYLQVNVKKNTKEA
jgi:hypothetical protein